MSKRTSLNNCPKHSELGNLLPKPLKVVFFFVIYVFLNCLLQQSGCEIIYGIQNVSSM